MSADNKVAPAPSRPGSRRFKLDNLIEVVAPQGGETLSPEDEEVIAMLKKMDRSGDGMLSIQDMIEAGRYTVELEKKGRRLVTTVVSLIMVMVLMAGVAFATSLAAVIFAKEMRAQGGVLKDAHSGAALATSKTVMRMGLNSNLTTTQLEGITSVSLAYKDPDTSRAIRASWTVTGYSQNADGSHLTLHTARGDQVKVVGSSTTIQLRDASLISFTSVPALRLSDLDTNRRRTLMEDTYELDYFAYVIMEVDSDLGDDALGTSNTRTSSRLISATMAVSYNGCFQDNRGRAFLQKRNGVTMQECIALALSAGEARFAMQWPQGYPGEQVECWFGDKGLLNQGAYVQRPDGECSGESWSPSAFGESFNYPGSGWRNAVYNIITAPDEMILEVGGNTYNVAQVETVVNDLATCQAISQATGGCMMVPVDLSIPGLPDCDALSSSTPGLATYYATDGEKCWLGAEKVESLIETVTYNGQQYTASELVTATENGLQDRLDRVSIPADASGLQDLDWLVCEAEDEYCSLNGDEVMQWVQEAFVGRVDRVAVPADATGLQDLDWLLCEPVDNKCTLDADEVTRWVLDAVTDASGCPDCPRCEPLEPRAALLEWRDTQGPLVGSSSISSWSMDEPLCSWAGFTCSDGEIRTIRIIDQAGLTGSFPPLGEIFCPGGDCTVHEGYAVRDQMSIYMYRNGFTGQIPVDLMWLPARILRIDGNQLTGPLPPEWVDFYDRLDTLNLQDMMLTGPLPPEWADMNVEVLKLARNSLTGTLPPEWRRLSNLETLTLQENNLEGDIPPEWAQAIPGAPNTGLKHSAYEVYLYPGNSGLSRTIPEGFCLDNGWPEYCPDDMTEEMMTLD